MATFSVMNHLSEWLMRPRLGDDKPPTLWPSSASAVDEEGNVHGTCKRRIFLQYLKQLVQYSKRSDGRYNFWDSLVEDVNNNSVPTSKYMYWIWEQGELFEAHTLDLIKESGIFLATQVQIYIPEYNISGKIDAIAYNPENNKNIICEIKSVYGPNGDKVLGSNWERKNTVFGEPRDYNLMQLAIYQWHYADDKFDYGQLIYGDRGTGKFSTYQVDVNKKTGSIKYRVIDPSMSEWVTVKYTIFDILNVYKYIQECADSGVIPAKDFQYQYDSSTFEALTDKSYSIIELDKEDEPVGTFNSINEFLKNDDNKKSRKFILETKGKTFLSKATAEKYVKYVDREKFGGRKVKFPEDGDYQCTAHCPFKWYCYNQDGSSKN